MKFSWGLEAYIKKCLWVIMVMLTHVYWFIYLPIFSSAVPNGSGAFLMPSCPSSVTFSFRTETRKYIDEFLQVCAPCHGGVLYSFWYWSNVVWIFMNFLNIEKKNYDFFFVNISCFLRILCYIYPTFKKIK